jgi:amino-acid N-acetyltransferase
MVHKANIKDIKSIHHLLQVYGSKGELLARPLSELYDHVRDFSVYKEPQAGKIVGCCALQICWEHLAEIRSLAVDPKFVGQKIGTQLTIQALDEAKALQIKKVFTLTYRPSFFKKFGFNQIKRSNLPLKIWADCMYCVKFPQCDEIAMMKEFK